MRSWRGEGPEERPLARADRGESPVAAVLREVLVGAAGWRGCLTDDKVEWVVVSSPGSDPSSSPALLSYGSSTASGTACRLLDAGALGL